MQVETFALTSSNTDDPVGTHFAQFYLAEAISKAYKGYENIFRKSISERKTTKQKRKEL